MEKKYFSRREEVIDVFHEKNYIPTIEKLSFHLASGFLVQSNLGRL